VTAFLRRFAENRGALIGIVILLVIVAVAVLAPLIRWDAPFYLALAKEGYPAPRAHSPVYHLGFLPLYPLAVRTFERVLGNFFWAAFAVSNVSALLAALLMLKLGGWKAALLFLASPGAHFLAYPYSEALFALALAAALVALQSERLVLAAAAGAAASATRPPGVAVAVALIAHAPRRLRNWAAAAAALSGMIAFMAWCRERYGDALAFVHIQGHHRRELSLLGPVKAFFAFEIRVGSDPLANIRRDLEGIGRQRRFGAAEAHGIVARAGSSVRLRFVRVGSCGLFGRRPGRLSHARRHPRSTESLRPCGSRGAGQCADQRGDEARAAGAKQAAPRHR